MSDVSLIVAMDESGGMGRENHLLCHLPADLKHFKTLTLGKPIIMGRKTFDSIGMVLPERLNVVLSRQALNIPGAVVVSTLNEAFELTREHAEVMVIGGADVFKQALPFATRLYVTLIHAKFEADVFFPSIDWRAWQLYTSEFRAHDEKNAYDMTFNQYGVMRSF
jgi:dihydrofolate reductase